MNRERKLCEPRPSLLSFWSFMSWAKAGAFPDAAIPAIPVSVDFLINERRFSMAVTFSVYTDEVVNLIYERKCVLLLMNPNLFDFHQTLQSLFSNILFYLQLSIHV